MPSVANAEDCESVPVPPPGTQPSVPVSNENSGIAAERVRKHGDSDRRLVRAPQDAVPNDVGHGGAADEARASG